MTYTDVCKMLTDKSCDLRKHYGDATEMLDTADELRMILSKARSKRGALDFRGSECKIDVDADGKAVGVSARVSDCATNLIEEFMLIANETVARKMTRAKLPVPYRTHEDPGNEKIMALASFLGRFNIKIRVKQFSGDAQKALASVKGKPEEALVNRVILRSLKQARYTPERIGHFGLALKYYCHFTSPIRRFPDLILHTVIKSYLRGEGGFARDERFMALFPEVCFHSSVAERRAEACEREVEKMKKAEYMEDKIGWAYDGVVSGITDGGLFIELPNTIEGFLSGGGIPGDSFHFDKENFCYRGRHTGACYSLGQKVTIRVKSAYKEEGRINFELEGGSRQEAPPSSRGRGRGFGKNQKKGKRGRKN